MNKRILYISLKNSDYYRVKLFSNTVIKNFPKSVVLSSNKKKYLLRFLEIQFKLIPYFFNINKKFDILVIGPMSQPLAPLFKIFWKKKVVHDFFISLYDTAVNDRKIFSKNNLFARLFNYLDKFSLKNSELVIIDTRENLKFYKKIFKIYKFNRKLKFEVVYIGSDEDNFKPSKIPKFSSELIITFHGTFIPLHGVPVILDAISILNKTNCKCFFNIIGKGQTYNDCVFQANMLKLNNIKFWGSVSKKDLNNIYKSTHIGLGIFSNSKKALRVIPNKVYDILLMNKALITAHNPEIDKFLIDKKNALLVKPNDAKELANKIGFVYKNPNLIYSLAKEGNKTYNRHWSEKNISLKLVKILKMV